MIQQQRMIEMEQQAAVNREAALRERREMLLQRRMEREEALAREEQQRQMMVQQMQANRQVENSEPVEVVDIESLTDSPEPVYQEPTSVADSVNLDLEKGIAMSSQENDNSPSEGYVKLADYLNGALEEGKDASGIVGQLKMALMMKMFSKDVLNEVLSEDFDTLVDIVGGVHPRLKSPKARLVLKDVVKGMK
jgi:hypothetical protein